MQAYLWVVLAGIVFGFGLFAWVLLQTLLKNRQLSDQLAQTAQEKTAYTDRAQKVLDFGRRLLNYSDAQKALEQAVEICADLSGADGCSFIPFNEWDSPLKPVLRGIFAAHQVQRLGKPETRQACKACATYSSLKITCKLFNEHESGPGFVICYPLYAANRQVGVINLHFAAQPENDPITDNLIKETVRLLGNSLGMFQGRRQESAALQFLRSAKPYDNAASSIVRILDKVRDELSISGIFLWVPAVRAGLQSPWLLESTNEDVQEYAMFRKADFLRGIWQSLKASDGSLLVQHAADRVQARKLLLAVPVESSNDLGMLLLINTGDIMLSARRSWMIEAAAQQISIHLSNAETLATAEYQATVAERTRLAREIHDGLAQTLAFLKLETARMQTYATNGDSDRLSVTLGLFNRTISDAYLDARQAIEQLRCDPGDDFETWLRQTAQKFSSASGIHVLVDEDFPAVKLPLTTSAQLFRVVQETLNNVRKHAEATEVRIVAREANGHLYIEIRDNGVGFLPEEVWVESQYGLQGMRERADILNADFQIISQPGEGTTVRIILARLASMEE